MFYGLNEVTPKAINDAKDVLKTLNEFLEGKKFFAGENLSIADFSILTTVTTFNVS